MIIDGGEYDNSQFSFDDKAQELVDRTHRRLERLFARLNVSSDELFYAAASAVECLCDRRSDYLLGLAECSPPEMRALRAQIGRTDCHFYFKVVRSWVATRSASGAAGHRPRS